MIKVYILTEQSATSRWWSACVSFLVLGLHFLRHKSVHYFLKVMKEQVSPFLTLSFREKSFDLGFTFLHLKSSVLAIRRLLLKVG